MERLTRREIGAVLAGPTVLAAASWVISRGWWWVTLIAVAVLLVVFLRLTARPAQWTEVSRPSSLPRRVSGSLRPLDGSSHGSVHARRSTRPVDRARATRPSASP